MLLLLMASAITTEAVACCITGGEPFSYQSVTVQQRMPIVLQGEFTFVRGLLSDIDPPQFTARVGRHSLAFCTSSPNQFSGSWGI
jgi:hypothetical protein